MDKINPIIHQPLRLKIMTILHMDKSVSFTNLKKELWTTDGNLGTHLEKLESKGYIRIDKSFVNKKPRSTVYMEKLGEKELLTYIEQIEEMFTWIR